MNTSEISYIVNRSKNCGIPAIRYVVASQQAN